MALVNLIGLLCVLGLSCVCFAKSIAIDEKTNIISIVPNTVTIGNYTQTGYLLTGSGPNWRNLDGVEGFVADISEGFYARYLNKLNEETIIHVHGQTPPTNLDGVPYISAVPLPPNSDLLYGFDFTEKEVNMGTFFIHSHFAFQKGKGATAPFIVTGTIDPAYPLAQELSSATEVLMFLEDFCPYYCDDGPPTNGICSFEETYSTLKEDYEGEPKPLPTCPGINAATNMDVCFTSLLANRKTIEDAQIINVQKGEFVRLRVINSCTMSNFNINLGNLTGILVATDGQLVSPLKNSTFWISVAQRMDILIQIPTTEEVLPILTVGEAVETSRIVVSGIILSSNSQATPDKVRASIAPAIKVAQNSPPGFMKAQSEIFLRSFYPLPSKPADKTYVINLTGNNGFDSINGKSYQLYPDVSVYQRNPYPVVVHTGERIHLEIHNNNDDNHAMHLHGHVFQVVAINGVQYQGAKRDVVLIPGGCSNVTIAFEANNPGVWPFHCHMSFHLAAGMLTTIEYQINN